MVENIETDNVKGNLNDTYLKNNSTNITSL